MLIHGQFLREDQVDSYKELGVIPSLFTMHTFYWGDWHHDHTVGAMGDRQAFKSLRGSILRSSRAS